jgi:FkbM family methyltransferase
MNAAIKLWRAVPVRGPGALFVAGIQRRARHGDLVAAGPHGVRYLVDPSNPAETSIYLWGTYEPEVMAVLERLLARGQTAIDVGANCGVITVMMAALVGPLGRVVAIDPSPAACDRTRRQAQLNGLQNVEVHDVALGAAADRDSFRMGRVGLGALPGVDAEFTTGRPIDVRVVTIDEIVGGSGNRVALVKIDTDGSEVAVLEGARDVLRRDRPALIVETYLEGFRRRGVGPADLAAILDEHGYELFVPRFAGRSSWRASAPRVKGFVPTPIAHLARGLIDELNVVAISRHEDGAAARTALLRSGQRSRRDAR